MKHILAVAALLFAVRTASAQGSSPPARPDSVTRLGPIKITAARTEVAPATPLQLSTLSTPATITARKIDETVNVLDPEDAVKYLPSVFLRKRNNGDTQATLATRVWGVSSSARSLIFADGVPLAALIANNNTIGGPRWGLVSPAEIARVDVMYGPYSAAYPGNSMGAVMEITTRSPDRLEGSITQTQSLQTFSLYGTDKTFGTTQTTGDIADRFGKFAVWASGNYQDSHSQPLTYVTASSVPSGTTGGFTATNKLGAPANVLGATGLLHTGMTNAKIKTTFDITPTLRAAYTFGLWRNDASSDVDAYSAASGQPTFAGQSGFASGFYDLTQQHHAQSLSLRSDTRSVWDVELVGTEYRFDTDKQRMPVTASSTGTTFNTAGRAAVLDGTGWGTVDLKGIWRSGATKPRHTVSAGVHYDRYSLLNTTFNTSDWANASTTTGVFTEGDGKTRTEALWAQDAWQLAPALVFTVGGRYESWRAFDGYNFSGTTSVRQPVVNGTRFSPKAVLAWTPVPEWAVTTSVGKAYRFATASELYQLVSTGPTFTSPNPNLKPDNVLAAELRVERRFERGHVQVSLFQDDTHDAIISQFLPLVANSSTLYSYVSNVDHVRSRGAEVVLGTTDLFVNGLELSASATGLDARTLALSGSASATAAPGSAIGKRLPNIPEWRASFAGTYHAAGNLALTLAGRYSSKLYTTLDNTDVNTNTYQGFAEWFVMDTHANYRVSRNWSVGAGVDNLLNRKYFLFHPFPQRTYVANLKFSF
jgi:iron complex outermembrane receptor protein